MQLAYAWILLEALGANNEAQDQIHFYCRLSAIYQNKCENKFI
jgi:hypothetical protein